ncbi:hypothetical protein LEP1GSC058_3659 [Leptospira fainei serovar Hurstbridge str. BUT 6]|uniref:Uncharacterized protein n=1 Tax=Leptospira fainei serovar Hurstbridge str. BUT 6 TaxID=1193011 RepID=S3W0J2_9LEPT|nr:hypothetical protein LEP1GSC058_3659 [Leptospira fainei serovar Hurstbridge str. BUT 6]
MTVQWCLGNDYPYQFPLSNKNYRRNSITGRKFFISLNQAFLSPYAAGI